jgi:hypothetical protein
MTQNNSNNSGVIQTNSNNSPISINPKLENKNSMVRTLKVVFIVLAILVVLAFYLKGVISKENAEKIGKFLTAIF